MANSTIAFVRTEVILAFRKVTGGEDWGLGEVRGELAGARISLLGGLAVQAGGSQSLTKFRTRKTGALLGFLATYGTTRVPRERLTELFWPEDEPKSARASLSTCLASIRSSCVEQGIPELIDADRFSVQLAAELRTDLDEFDRLIARADAESNPDLKATWLRSALDLYAGPYMSGYDDDWVLAEREHRSDEYVRAVRKLLRVLGELGAKSEAIKTARMAVRSEPTREALTRDLMRLLIAAEEPAAALESYRQLERNLESSFGLRPSAKALRLAEFVESYQAKPRPDTCDPVTPVPRRPAITSALSLFVGRDEEQQLLRRLIGKNHVRLISIVGFGGVGKSRLAREAAVEAQSRFPDGASWIALDGYSSADSLWTALARSVGIATVREQAVIHALSQKQMLAVVDNAEHLLPEIAACLHRLLLACPGLRLVVTTRAPLQIDGEHIVRLGPLGVSTESDEKTNAEDLCLFEDRFGAANPGYEMGDEERNRVRSFISRLAGIPLAIEMVAALTPAHAIADLASQFPETAKLTSSRVDHLGRHQVLSRVIATSVAFLSPPARHLLERLWPLASGFTWEMANEASGGDPMAALRELEDSSVIYSTETRHGHRFMVLRVVRECVAAEMPSQARHDSIRWAVRELSRFSEPTDCLGYRSEQSVAYGIHNIDNIVSCAALAFEEGLADAASDLLTSHAASYKLSDHIPRIIELTTKLEPLVDLDRRLRLGATAAVLSVIGTIEVGWPTEIIDGFLALAESSGQGRFMAMAYTYAALRAAWHQRDPDRALDMFGQAQTVPAVELDPATGNLVSLWANEVMIGLGRVGKVWETLERLQKENCLREGTELQMFFSQRAYAGACTGRYGQGIEASLALRDLCTRLGDYPNFGHSFFLEATNLSYEGFYEEALPLYDRHVEIMRKHASLDLPGIRAGERRAVVCCLMMGRQAEARRRYEAIGSEHVLEVLLAIGEDDLPKARARLADLLETSFEQRSLDGAALVFDICARIVFGLGNEVLAQELCGYSDAVRQDLGIVAPHQYQVMRPKLIPIEPVGAESKSEMVRKVISLIKVPSPC